MATTIAARARENSTWKRMFERNLKVKLKRIKESLREKKKETKSGWGRAREREADEREREKSSKAERKSWLLKPFPLKSYLLPYD